MASLINPTFTKNNNPLEFIVSNQSNDHCPIHLCKFFVFCKNCNEELCVNCIKEHKRNIETSDHILSEEINSERKILYLKLIKKYPTSPIYYYKLARILKANETINLILPGTNNPTDYDIKSLSLKCLEYDINFSRGYNCLATTLKNLQDTIMLPNGKAMNKKELYFKALELDENYAGVYNNLGTIVGSFGSIELPNNKKMNKQQLYLKALELCPNDPDYYFNLNLTLNSNEETVRLNNGEILNREQIAIKIIEIDSYDRDTYENLIGFQKKNVIIKSSVIGPQNFPLYEILKDNFQICNQIFYKRNLLFGKPLTIDSILSKFYEYFKLESTISSIRVYFLSNEIPDKLNSIILMKSYVKFLLKHGNDTELYNRVVLLTLCSKIVWLQADLHPILLVLLKSFGDNKVIQLDHSKEKKEGITFLYQEFLFILTNQYPHDLLTLYLVAILLDIVEYFDNYYKIKTNFIYQWILTKISTVKIDEPIQSIKDQIFKHLNLQFFHTDFIDIRSFLQISTNSNSNILIEYIKSKKTLPEKLALDYYCIFNKLHELGDSNSNSVGDNEIDDNLRQSIMLNPYSSETFYLISRLLGDNKIDGKYSKKQLLILSIQLGSCDSSVFYNLAMLIGVKGVVRLPILMDSESSNDYFTYFDLICQAIYHDPIQFSTSTFRYYLSLIRFLINNF